MSIKEMATSFLSKGPIQLDNMIVYRAPPASRKKPGPQAKTFEQSAPRPAESLEARWPTSASRTDSTADSDECIAMDVDFSPIDHHAQYGRHDGATDNRTSCSGDHQQMSLDWLEPLESFNFGEIVYNGQLSPELGVQGFSAAPSLGLEPTMELPAVVVDTDPDFPQSGLSDSVEFSTVLSSAVQSGPESRTSKDETRIGAVADMAATDLPSSSRCRGPATIDLPSDDVLELSDDGKAVASESAAGPLTSPDLATLNGSELSRASRGELHPAGTEAVTGFQLSQKGLSDDIGASTDIDLTDLLPPAVEGEKSVCAEQNHVNEELHEQGCQEQRSPLHRSESELSHSVQSTDCATDDDEGAPFVPGRRRCGLLSARSPLYRQDVDDFRGDPATSSEGQYGTPEISSQGRLGRHGRKRMHVRCTHLDDDDFVSKEAELLRKADEPQRRRKARKRCGSSDRRSQRPGWSAVTACSPETVQRPSQPSRRRHCQDHDARSQRLSLASTPPELPEQPTWAIDRIVRCSLKNGKVFYRVKWKDTWEPATSLQGCADTAVAEFHAGRPTTRSNNE